MRLVHASSRNPHQGSASGRLARGWPRVLENEEPSIEFDVEPGVDQRNDGCDVLRIGHGPLLQHQRTLTENQRYRSFAGVVGPDEAHERSIIAAFETGDRQRAVGQRYVLVQQNARRRGSERDVAHLLEIAGVVDEEGAVGDDENRHRRLILDAKLATWPRKVELTLRALAVRRMLQEAGLYG